MTTTSTQTRVIDGVELPAPGTWEIDPGHADVVASVSSGSDAPDEHLRSAELFDVENFPQAAFRSVQVDWHLGAESTLRT